MATPMYDSLLSVSATVTSNANGTSIQIDKNPEVAITVIIGSVSGAGATLDVAFEGSVDGSTWVQVVKHPQLVTASANKTFTGIKLDMSAYKFIRPVYVVGGTTPSFAFTVKYN